MSKKDTQYMLSYSKGPNAPQYPKPKITRYLKDGETITLGDMQIFIVETPGHTIGGVSLIFPVKLGSKTYKAMLWGGTGIPNDRGLQKAYRASLEKFEKYAKAHNVSVELSAHLFRDNGYKRLESVYNQTYKGEHPFVVGEEKIQNFFNSYKKLVNEKLKAWEQ